MLQRINNNTYKIDLPGDYNVSATFNVTDLSPFEFADYDQVDSRTNPFQEGGNDVIIDSTTPKKDSVIHTPTHVGANFSPTSSTLDHHQINSPSWRKDPLIGLGGPMTRSRAKKIKEALYGLVRSIQQTTKPQVEEKSNFITLLRVIEE